MTASLILFAIIYAVHHTYFCRIKKGGKIQYTPQLKCRRLYQITCAVCLSESLKAVTLCVCVIGKCG